MGALTVLGREEMAMMRAERGTGRGRKRRMVEGPIGARGTIQVVIHLDHRGEDQRILTECPESTVLVVPVTNWNCVKVIVVNV